MIQGTVITKCKLSVRNFQLWQFCLIRDKCIPAVKDFIAQTWPIFMKKLRLIQHFVILEIWTLLLCYWEKWEFVGGNSILFAFCYNFPVKGAASTLLHVRECIFRERHNEISCIYCLTFSFFHKCNRFNCRWVCNMKVQHIYILILAVS